MNAIQKREVLQIAFLLATLLLVGCQSAQTQTGGLSFSLREKATRNRPSVGGYWE